MQSRKLYALVLAGGHGSRMGQEKAWLEVNGETLALRACRQLKHVCDLVFLSIRESQFEKASQLLRAQQPETQLLVDDWQEIGPTAALLKAYERDAEASWLVFACDFVLADEQAFLNLKLAFEKAASTSPEQIICYENAEQFAEPLFAIWTPRALSALKKNVQNKKYGPSFTLNALSPLRLKAHHSDILLNANEPQEWNEALKKLIETK